MSIQNCPEVVKNITTKKHMLLITNVAREKQNVSRAIKISHYR